jgi:hypothetical protein
VAKSSFFLFLFLSFAELFGQSSFNGYYTFSTGYDSNPLIMSESESSTIIRNSIGIGYFPELINFALSYSSTFSSLIDFPERNYYSHSIKTDYSFQPFNYEYFDIGLGLNSKLRNNSIDAELYNYFDLSADINFNLYSDIGVITLDYVPTVTRFENYNLLNNIQNEVSLALEKTLTFGTTILAQTSYGSKYFSNAQITSESPHSPWGKGKNYKRFSNSPNQNQMPNSVYYSQNTNIINFYLEIEQALIEDMTFAIALNANIHPEDDGFYFSSGTTDLFNDSEFFNDIYNFDENGIIAKFRVNLSDNIKFNTSYNYYQRDFLYTLDLINQDYSDDIKRRDTGNMLSSHVSYNPDSTLLFFESISIVMKFDYLVNKSNLNEYTFDTYSLFLSTILEF